MPVSCPLSSPVCQAFSDATVLQTLTSRASYLRSARFLLSEPQNIPDFLSFTASPLGSVVGTIVLCSLDVMDFNTKKTSTPNSYLIKEGERKQGYF